MRKCVRKYKDEELGFRVTVIQYKKKYDLEILLPKEIFSKTQNISIKTKQFSLSANAFNLPWQTPCIIKASRYYKKGKYGLIKNVKEKIDFETDNCFGFIILSPRFYIPSQKRATPENVKKEIDRTQSYINKNHNLLSLKNGIN